MMNQQNARAKIHCIFYRDFKTWSSAIVRERKKEKMAEMDATQQKQKPKKKTREQREQRVKVEGKARLELFSEWIDG